ncbi:MAG: hypothetical protein ACRD3W_21345 [Terriglobales bacterium]
MTSLEAFRRELRLVRSARGTDPVLAGRAHYLRFNSLESPALLERVGIQYDESVGWPGHIAFRLGAAGPCRLYDAANGRVINLIEMPLVCMDSTLAASGGIQQFAKIYDHLREIGGMVSVLFHPGTGHNPEYPEFDNIYNLTLTRVSEDGGRSWTPSEIVAARSAFVATPVHVP